MPRHGLEIRRINDWEMDAALRQQVEVLVRTCFPGYPARGYSKLPPHERYLATLGDVLVAHVGIEHRLLRVGDHVFKARGIADLCVSEGHRSHGIATSLLVEITTYAQSCGVDFVVLFADKHDVYLRSGWTLVGNLCSWVKIDEHRTLGIAAGTLGDCMMVKPIGDHVWPSGEVDMLGHVF
jgi:GNAT superfamily N-acetyltransferase